MEQKFFKVERAGDGLALFGKNTSQAQSPDNIFFSVSFYGKPPYMSTPRRIEIPPKYEYKGELLGIVEISGHPFEECNDLEELVIPETIRRILYIPSGTRWAYRHHPILGRFRNP